VFGFIKKTTSYGIENNIFTLHIPPLSSTHFYDFVVLTSLTHPRKILLVVLQIGKAKDLSALLRIRGGLISLWLYKESNKLRD
jgi:hypothetical protein